MRLFGLIGNPLVHSFSEKYFAEKFFSEDIIDCSYRNFPLSSVDLLPELIANEHELCGFNVTIPYKTEVLRYLHSLDAVAEAVGAVNTVKVSREKGCVTLRGFNTDVPAFRESLEKQTGAMFTNALVLGTGGASSAVVYVLENMGAIVRRVSRVAGRGNLIYAQLTPALIRDVDLIVNTTPVGMYPDTLLCPPIIYNALDSHHTLYDLIYNPLKTKFLKKGEEQGCKIFNGLEMLHLQADMAWDIWNDNAAI